LGHRLVAKFRSPANTHIHEFAVKPEGKFDLLDIAPGRCQNTVLKRSEKFAGCVLTDLHSVNLFTPAFDSDLCPGSGYFTLRKFVLGSLH
jgi:hypothetical protein